MASRAVFLDRDGTINVDAGYPVKISDLSLLPGAAAAITALNKLGIKVIVVSNQSGIGRGFFDRDDVDRFNSELNRRLAEHGARIDAFYYCPHAPGPEGEPACDCRKPGTGLLGQAADELAIDLESSFMVGDKISDIAAGISSGCRTILLNDNVEAGSDYGLKPDHEAADLLTATEWILSQIDERNNEIIK